MSVITCKHNTQPPSYGSRETECSLHMKLNFVTRNTEDVTNKLQTTKGVEKRLVTTLYTENLAEICLLFLIACSYFLSK